MVFYFTGTGNSLWAAKALSNAFDEPLISITDELKRGLKDYTYVLKENERIFFVYPVHSWGPAVMVLQFIKSLKLNGYEKQSIYSVSTCGDECGYTSDRMHSALLRRGLTLTGSYSIIMPNNYILMQGFNVDTENVEKEKLQKAPDRINDIIEAIRLQSVVDLYHTGSIPFLKSRIIYLLFVKYAIGKNSFFSTEKCIACGLCERVCPTGTISQSNTGKPKWRNTCVQCVACIHRCPVGAIEYGKQTQRKGRYYHPEINNL